MNDNQNNTNQDVDNFVDLPSFSYKDDFDDASVDTIHNNAVENESMESDTVDENSIKDLNEKMKAMKNKDTKYDFSSYAPPIIPKESLTNSMIKLGIISAIIAIGALIISKTSDISSKTITAFVLLVICCYIPMLIYHRLIKIELNEELKSNFNIYEFFSTRVLYVVRKHISSLFMISVSVLILLYGILFSSPTIAIIVIGSIFTTIALKLILTPPIIQKLLHLDDTTEYHYVHLCNWLIVTIVGILSFIVVSFAINYNIDPQAIVGKLAQTTYATDNLNSNFISIFLETLVTANNLQDLSLGLSKNYPYVYYPVKAIIHDLPFAMLAMHVSFMFLIATLNSNRIAYAFKKQVWAKKNRNFILRYWKEILLPIFLLSLIGGVYHVGKPFYYKYQSQLMYHGPVTTEANAVKIDNKFYRLDTLNEIKQLKLQAIKDIKRVYHSAVGEINNEFDTFVENSKLFINWFEAENKAHPFVAGDAKLKRAYQSTLNTQKLDLTLTNIQQDVEKEVRQIISDLYNHIEQKLKTSELTKDQKVQLKDIVTNEQSTLEQIYTLTLSEQSLNNKNNTNSNASSVTEDTNPNVKKEKFVEYIYIKDTFKLLDSIPNVEKMLLKDFGNPNSIWFSSQASKEQQQIEDILFSELDDTKPIKSINDNTSLNYNSLYESNCKTINETREVVIETLAKAVAIDPAEIKKTEDVKPALEEQIIEDSGNIDNEALDSNVTD